MYSEELNNLCIYLHQRYFDHWSDPDYRSSFTSDKDYWDEIIRQVCDFIGVDTVEDITQKHIDNILKEERHVDMCSRSASWCYLKDVKHKFKEENMAEFGSIRNDGIGGSDIGAIMGVNKYRSPLQVWMDKTGRSEKFEGNDATRWGHLKEPLILQEICRKHDLEFSDMTPEVAEKMGYVYQDYPDEHKKITLATIIHSKVPFFRVNIDGIGFEKDETPILLEAKTTREYMAYQWEDGAIPESYYMQLQWGLFILGWKKAIIGCLIGSADFVTREVEADEDLQRKMIRAAGEFWTKYVLTDKEPPAAAPDKEAIEKLYPEVKNKGYVDMDDQANNLEQLDKIKAEIKDLYAKKDEIENILKQQVGEYEAGKVGDRMVSWKCYERKSLDIDTIAAELGMSTKEMKEKYSTISSYRKLSIGKWK